MAAILVVLGLGINACQDPLLQERTNFQELIGEYLENNPENFSTFVDVINKAESMAFLKAYGGYTVLAPTNDAFSKYLTEIGKQSVSQLTKDELIDIVKYHVIGEVIISIDFVDGRLNAKNMFGHFITTGTFFENGQAVLKLNKRANVISKDILLSNGIIHTVSEVIIPEKKSAAVVLNESGRFKIFVDALKITGLYDTLDIKNGPHTVFAVPDDVYQQEGFTTLNDLINDVAPDGGDFKKRDNPMNLYMAYHILDNRLKYITDLIFDRAGLTRAPNEVLTFKVKADKVLVNDDVFAGIYEPGFEIDRLASDRTVFNGVIHEMKADFRVKVRYPFAVYWSVTDQLEIMRMPGVFRRPGDKVPLVNGQLENISWQGGTSDFFYLGQGGGAASPWVVHGDLFEIFLRPERVPWVEFKTPVLVAGNYKIWVCFRGSSAERHPVFFVYFNEIALPNIIRTSPFNPHNRAEEPGFSEKELEARGYKFYQWRPEDITYTRTTNGVPYNITESNYISDGRVFAQLAGSITIPTTGSHKLKFVAISGTKEFWLDMVHFIPVEEDQLWPRINTRTGELISKEEINAQFQLPR